MLKTNRSFKTQFRFEMHDSSSSPGDGMAFVLTSEGSDSIGGIGGGLGYDFGGRSVAVEFDIFDNGGEPSGNHIGINLNGNAGNHVADVTPAFDLYGGVRWVWITYAAKSGKLKVFVDDDKTKKGAEKLSYKHKLKQALGRKARAGFTAATGGADADMDVLSWKLKQK